MATYFEHNDSKGLDQRLMVQAHNGMRERMLATFQEYDAGCVTLYISKHSLQCRLREAKGLAPYKPKWAKEVIY